MACGSSILTTPVNLCIYFLRADVDHCRGVFLIIPLLIKLVQPGNVESMAHLSSCLHNCYKLLFPVRHAKLEQSRINLTMISLVLNVDSHRFIPTQLTIKDLRSSKYCFL